MEKGGEGSSTSQMPQVAHSAPIPPSPKMHLTGNLAGNWKKFKRMWNNYEVDLEPKVTTQDSYLILTCIGPDVVDIYDALPFDNDEEKTNIAKVLALLEKYFIGETNETYERYLFNKREQESRESFDAYLTNLRSLAKTCIFGELRDNLIRDRIVINIGIRDNSIRKKLLGEGKLTLDKCINICRANETTAKQL